MARVKMMSLLTVSVILIVMMAVGALPAVANDPSYAGDDGTQGKSISDKSRSEMYDRDKMGCDCDRYSMGHGDKMRTERMGYERMHKQPRDVYMAVTAGGMAGDTATFGVNGIGMMGKDGMAMVATFNSPLTGTYNASSDMGYISTANFLPATIVVDKAGNASMPVSGSSAIVGLHGIKTLTKEKGYKVSEFSSVSVYAPGGVVKFFRLDRPVKVTYSMDRKMIVIDAYPSFTKRMGDAFSGSGATVFVAPEQPVTIASLMEADKMAKPETIGYEAPAYVAPPK